MGQQKGSWVGPGGPNNLPKEEMGSGLTSCKPISYRHVSRRTSSSSLSLKGYHLDLSNPTPRLTEESLGPAESWWRAGILAILHSRDSRDVGMCSFVHMHEGLCTVCT